MFILARPAVTAPIIRPRTMEHLSATESPLDSAMLRRIDETAPPGTMALRAAAISPCRSPILGSVVASKHERG